MQGLLLPHPRFHTLTFLLPPRIMADLDYDRLYDELAALERETGTILSSSPTQRVSGEVLESLTAVRHTRPMLSLSLIHICPVYLFLGIKHG